MANGQRVKILETRNATRIRKELMLLRKFLGHEDSDVPVIYDETRREDGSKSIQRRQELPNSAQVINSSGEKLYEDVFDQDDEDDGDDGEIVIGGVPLKED